MKKIFITTMFTLATFCFVSAQEKELMSEIKSAEGITFAKGDMFAEGSIKISTGGNTDLYAFNPKFGYFLNDKFAVGAKVGFESEKTDDTNTKINKFGIGGFARYYFLELGKKRFKAYGEAGLGYGRNKKEVSLGESVTKDIDNTITADLNIGLNYFITKNLAATFTLANILSYNSVSPENGDSTNVFELNVNLFENIFDQPQFGLLYRF